MDGSCFNEAAGADPADAHHSTGSSLTMPWRFNEAAGADPADAIGSLADILEVSGVLQ